MPVALLLVDVNKGGVGGENIALIVPVEFESIVLPTAVADFSAFSHSQELNIRGTISSLEGKSDTLNAHGGTTAYGSDVLPLLIDLLRLGLGERKLDCGFSQGIKFLDSVNIVSKKTCNSCSHLLEASH